MYAKPSSNGFSRLRPCEKVYKTLIARIYAPYCPYKILWNRALNKNGKLWAHFSHIPGNNFPFNQPHRSKNIDQTLDWRENYVDWIIFAKVIGETSQIRIFCKWSPGCWCCGNILYCKVAQQCLWNIFVTIFWRSRPTPKSILQK